MKKQNKRKKGVISVKMVIYGKESLSREVHRTGACGRVYLPRSWVGKKVKIIRLNEEGTKC